MAEESVDDVYDGCVPEMWQMVATKYKKEEKQYKDAWKNGKECRKRNLRKQHPIDHSLNKHHMQAICVYTFDSSTFSGAFNKAVQTGRKQYGGSFPYHTFHFLLTTVIEILGANQPCHTTYRRSTYTFTGNVRQNIRFGSFVSTTRNPLHSGFGRETCFNITTCAGASLKHYSYFEHEEEVLIPPYEIFNITQILRGEHVQSRLRDCKVIYVLDAIHFLSNVNCQAAGI
ncbi:hypothetical protein LDENG_00111480 [Lucifuga dentata]|nr:hypothetical protein LDENG_00111480 [Lucifuga dentata]